MRNPIATIYLENEKRIVIELLPDVAPNTVNSFIYAATNHIFDDHIIERIVPDNWIDMSYSGFHKSEGKYLIPYESDIHPEIEPLPSDFGCVCMGGYGDLGQAGCEFFFPLRPCPDHKGIYPVFGKVLEGIEELERIKSLELEPLDLGLGYEINRSLEPQKIIKVEVELFGRDYPEPIRVEMKEMPKSWQLDMKE